MPFFSHGCDVLFVYDDQFTEDVVNELRTAVRNFNESKVSSEDKSRICSDDFLADLDVVIKKYVSVKG